jgi:hypothetical protein
MYLWIHQVSRLPWATIVVATQCNTAERLLNVNPTLFPSSASTSHSRTHTPQHSTTSSRTIPSHRSISTSFLFSIHTPHPNMRSQTQKSNATRFSERLHVHRCHQDHEEKRSSKGREERIERRKNIKRSSRLGPPRPRPRFPPRV